MLETIVISASCRFHAFETRIFDHEHIAPVKNLYKIMQIISTQCAGVYKTDSEILTILLRFANPVP